LNAVWVHAVPNAGRVLPVPAACLGSAPQSAVTVNVARVKTSANVLRRAFLVAPAAIPPSVTPLPAMCGAARMQSLALSAVLQIIAWRASASAPQNAKARNVEMTAAAVAVGIVVSASRAQVASVSDVEMKSALR